MDYSLITKFANEAAAENPGLLQALGIDWKLLITQGIAFMVLVAVLGKFVYPALIKAIDSRREAIESSLEEAKKVQEDAATAEDKIEKLLVEARKEADEIVKRSQQEAVSIVSEASDKAKTRAESFLKDAHAQLEAVVNEARQTLKKDTVVLVVAATERILKDKIDPKKDEKLIIQSLEKDRA
jgi:F-type H+-transporting ATPase subunit b